jgi:hypothetical protein
MPPPSEKTLEINYVRNYLYNQHFVWQGATLIDEGTNGWDVKLDRLVQGRSYILQFKRPYSVKQQANGTKFVFYINNNSHCDQNYLLYLLARNLGPRNVFYAFPCIEDISELANQRNTIISKTKIVDINHNNFSNLGFVKHKVEITRNNQGQYSVQVFSEPKDVDFYC